MKISQRQSFGGTDLDSEGGGVSRWDVESLGVGVRLRVRWVNHNAHTFAA